MSSFKRIAAGASALVLASGAALAGAGVAGAQGSSAIAADLELAATALNGPVTVTGNDEGGPTVTYTNENDIGDRCIGFTMPYSTVADLSLDPGSLELEDIDAGQALLALIEAGGDTAALTTDGVGGDPISTSGGLLAAFGAWFYGTGVTPEPGETATWEAVAPTDEPAAAVIFCNPDGNLDIANWGIYFGIDPQVVADQINDRLGPLGSIGAGSVSGGSVGMGASLLGSLGGGDETENEESDGSSTASSGVSEAGSGSGDENGELPAATLVN